MNGADASRAFLRRPRTSFIIPLWHSFSNHCWTQPALGCVLLGALSSPSTQSWKRLSNCGSTESSFDVDDPLQQHPRVRRSRNEALSTSMLAQKLGLVRAWKNYGRARVRQLVTQESAEKRNRPVGSRDGAIVQIESNEVYLPWKSLGYNLPGL